MVKLDFQGNGLSDKKTWIFSVVIYIINNSLYGFWKLKKGVCGISSWVFEGGPVVESLKKSPKKKLMGFWRGSSGRIPKKITQKETHGFWRGSSGRIPTKITQKKKHILWLIPMAIFGSFWPTLRSSNPTHWASKEPQPLELVVWPGKSQHLRESGVTKLPDRDPP